MKAFLSPAALVLTLLATPIAAQREVPEPEDLKPRDGAATIEVVMRLLAGLKTLDYSSELLRAPALAMARDATARARQALTAESDLETLAAAAAFAQAEAEAEASRPTRRRAKKAPPKG